MRLQKIFNISLITLLVAMFATSCGRVSVPDGEFLIKGSVSSVADGAVVGIYDISGDGAMSVIARDTIVSGEFTLSGKVPESGQASMVGLTRDFSIYSLGLYIDSSDYIEVSGDGYTISLWDVKSANPKQKKLTQYDNVGRDLIAPASQISILARRLSDDVVKNGGDSEAYSRVKDEIQYYRDIIDSYEASLIMMKAEYMKSKRVDQVWIDYYEDLIRYVGYSGVDPLFVEACQELYKKLPDSLLSSERGEAITLTLYPPQIIEVGDMMADATLYDIDGKERTLSEFSGRYILLDFWSRGCGPCVSSFDETELMAQKYSSKLSIVSISSDSKKVWTDYVTSENLKGNHWKDSFKDYKL